MLAHMQLTLIESIALLLVAVIVMLICKIIGDD